MNTARKILIVGGQSRAAIAFRRLVSSTNEFQLSILVRRPENKSEAPIHVVDDYFQPPAEVLKGIDTIVNFAGIVDAKKSSEFMRVNAQGPCTLAAMARANGIRQFVHISSLSIYGDATDINRDTAETPTSDYGRSKKAGDEGLMSRADATLSVALMRVPTLYNRDAGDKLHLLANTMRRLGWWPIPNASQPRSVLHLDNLARAIVLTLRSGASGVQFAADPEPMVLPMLADACEMSGNGRVRLVRLPEVAFSPLRLAARDLFRSLYGRSLIASELCLRDDSLPFRSTRDGLLDLFPSSPQDTRNGRS